MLDRLTTYGLAFTLLMLCAGTVRAQDTEEEVIPWEYRSYKVKLYVTYDASPWFSASRRENLLRSFEQRSYREGGAAWDVTAEDCPKIWSGYLQSGVGGLTLEQVLTDDAPLLDAYDKLIFLRLSESEEEFLAEARELDCRTRYWGPIRKRTAIQPELIDSQAYDAVLNSFAPLVRVGRKLEDGTVDCTLRAGYLIVEEASPAELRVKDILLPITRHNDREGQPRPNGIVPSPWTFLTVKTTEGGKLNCDLHSGVRNSIGARSSRRKERLALTIDLEPQSSTLVLKTKADEPEPLVGYEVHSKSPFAESGFEFLGRTNWDGELEIKPDPTSPLRVLYVKNGDRVLNRLPVVPGLDELILAELGDDSRRLEAEGVVSGIESKVMDLVAMRAILAATIARELDQGNIEKAEAAHKKFRDLPKPSQLSVALEQHQRRIVASTSDTRLRSRIDAVFDGAKTLIVTLIDQGQEARLGAEIAAAKSRGSAPAPAPSPAPAPNPTPEPTPPEPSPSASEPLRQRIDSGGQRQRVVGRLAFLNVNTSQ